MFFNACPSIHNEFEAIDLTLIFIHIFKFWILSSSSASPESGLGTSHSSLPGSGQGSTNDHHMNDDMYYDTDPLPPLGTCKALYPFDGKTW